MYGWATSERLLILKIYIYKLSIPLVTFIYMQSKYVLLKMFKRALLNTSVESKYFFFFFRVYSLVQVLEVKRDWRTDEEKRRTSALFTDYRFNIL